ncbi:MAG: hypothetical protein AAGC60_07710 [Acidobacteriota bacterium]
MSRSCHALARRTFLFFLCFVLTGFAAHGVTLITDMAHAPGGPPSKNETSDDPLRSFEPADAITEIYQRFEDAARASGQSIRFELGEPETFRREQFGELIWIDLFTPPGGWTLETVLHVRMGDLPSLELISFVSNWENNDDHSWNAQEFVKSTTLLRADGAVDRLGAWNEERFAELEALSTYEVTVTFAERSRTYRALVLWKALAPDTLLFTLADHVTPEVAQAFHEERTLASEDEILAPPRTTATLPLKIQCLPYDNRDYYGPLLSTGTITTDHSSGGHSAKLKVKRYCSANGCFSTCEPSSSIRSCVEAGRVSTGYWHKKSTRVVVDSETGYATDPAECGYAWGCAVKKCLLGFCGAASFGASGRGAEIKVNATSPVLTDMSLNSGSQCPPLQIDTGGGCQGLVDEVVTLSLNDASVKSALPATDFTLSRLEASSAMHHGQQVSYLMGEWALLEHKRPHGKASAVVETLGSSNRDFASAKRHELENALATSSIDPARAGKVSSEQQVLLVVGLPMHEPNDRKIAMPELKVTADRMTATTKPRRILVRADFAEDHSLQKLDILHDSLGGVPHSLALEIERSLRLESATDEEHRVVAFALLSVGESLELEGVVPYLPKCCCGLGFC